MRYWWVSQGNNYDIVMEQGILWSRPVGNGVVPQHRLVLKDMRPGDLLTRPVELRRNQECQRRLRCNTRPWA